MRWGVCGGCYRGRRSQCDAPAGVVLDQMPLHLGVGDKSKFAKRALMDGHVVLLLFRLRGLIKLLSHANSMAFRCGFDGDSFWLHVSRAQCSVTSIEPDQAGHWGGRRTGSSRLHIRHMWISPRRDCVSLRRSNYQKVEMRVWT
jgi:hypothetical protein